MGIDLKTAGVLGRRQVMVGLAASAVAACTKRVAEPLVSPLDPDNDPLARFRLFVDDGADKWRQHLPPFSPSDGRYVLALSGGGGDGAFGAGALAGWSASGTRPRLDLVTGVSTGALIAPFAFVGQEGDTDLQRIFTQHDAGDIMRLRPWQAAFGDALYDTTPLAELIAEYTPPSALQTVADRHATGARLFIVTSELDSARASVWDMGAIAQAGQYDLFRNIMRGSAALPGLFSPVNLRYVANGKTYSETHIDGGVHMQFLALPDFAFTNPQEKLAGGHVHLLINNTLKPAPEGVTRSAMSISQQALTTTGRANAQLAVNATQLFAREHGMKLSVTSIDPASGIVHDPSDRFSPNYMNALYRHGYQRGVQNALWTEKA